MHQNQCSLLFCSSLCSLHIPSLQAHDLAHHSILSLRMEESCASSDDFYSQTHRACHQLLAAFGSFGTSEAAQGAHGDSHTAGATAPRNPSVTPPAQSYIPHPHLSTRQHLCGICPKPFKHVSNATRCQFAKHKLGVTANGKPSKRSNPNPKHRREPEKLLVQQPLQDAPLQEEVRVFWERSSESDRLALLCLPGLPGLERLKILVSHPIALLNCNLPCSGAV